MAVVVGIGRSVAFSSAAELSFLIEGLGQRVDVIQLEVGRLNGVFQSEVIGGAVLLSITTNRRLLLYGERQPGVISVSLEVNGQLDHHAAHGQRIDDPFTVTGMKPDLSEIYCQLSAGSGNLFALVRHAQFDAFARSCGHPRVADCLYEANQQRLTPMAFAGLRQAMLNRLERPDCFAGPHATEQLFTILLEALMCEQEGSFVPFKQTSRAHVVKDFVRWSLSDELAPVGLEEVSQRVFSSRRTLIQGCQESFAIGPMELLRYIRLHRVNAALADPSIRQKLGLERVQEVARHYGFLSRGHFARAYQDLFECSPAATLMASS